MESIVLFLLAVGQFAEADIAKSLLHMISNDIGQVSVFICCMSFKIKSSDLVNR